ncbi:uncharacterized protein [Temnothorax nylanderi]|uniref:uncharacterized protein isoform X2 n=1 Tax=Temnothorax nylanderi TaxID=102681 RepID=UPI003A8B6644
MQAVLRKWRKLRLSEVPRTILSMTMVLPLLPSNMFQEALHIIQAEADLLSREYPDILCFTSYLRLTWSNMASKISTFDCPIRTNNIVESFHNTAVYKLGTRNINVWTFLEKLKNLILDQELDFRRLQIGVRARRTRTRASRERDIKIHNMQEDLVHNRLPLKQFLLMFTTDNKIFEMERLTSFDEDELSSDVQIADIEFFSDNLNEIFETDRQTGRTNTRHRRSRRIRDIPLSSAREEENEANTEHELSSDTQTVRMEFLENLNETFETDRQSGSQRVYDIPLSSPREEETGSRHVHDISLSSPKEEETGSRRVHNIPLSSPREEETGSRRVHDIPLSSPREEETGSRRVHDIPLFSPREEETGSRHVHDIPLSSPREEETGFEREYDIPLFSPREEENEANADDSSIYEVPEDDYGYWYEDNNNTHREDLPFHAINRDYQNSNVSGAKPSEETCTVCLTNERTHVFILCGHLACCIECIEKLERNRCPIFNTTYENCFRVRRP